MSYGPMPVADPPETPPAYVSTRNASDATRRCLVWDHDVLAPAEDERNTSFDLLPSVARMNVNASRPLMRKRRGPQALPATCDLFSIQPSDALTSRRKGGVRLLSTTRAMVGDPHYLEGDEEAEAAKGHKKKCSDLWEWQRHAFNLRHEEAADIRSPLQVAQDAAREEDRKRAVAFQQHLKRQAMYQSVNRVALRKAPPGPVLSPPDHPSVAFAPKPPPLPKQLPTFDIAAVRRIQAAGAERTKEWNTAPLAAAKKPSTVPSDSPRKVLSARVREKINQLAAEFLTPRAAVRDAPTAMPS